MDKSLKITPDVAPVGDIELGDQREPNPLSGMPGGVNRKIGEMQPDITAMRSYKPQFDLQYDPVAIEPNAREADLMKSIKIHASRDMLDPQNPDSPYNDMAGSCYGVDVLRATPVTSTDPGLYQGSMTDGMRHGIGTCTWADGSSYTGDWTQNRRHGKGTYTVIDGIRFEGNWVNDVKHGPGRLTYANGETICGTW